MDSHILIPKCVLKKFEDDKQSLHCYDIAEKKYCLKRSKSLYTEQNHYSTEVENYLNREIETPIGNIIKKLETCSHTPSFSITKDEYKSIKKYAYALMARSQEMKDEIKKNLIFKEWFTQQNINDISAVRAFKLANQKDFLKDFNMTFMFLHNDSEFVLPLQGHCDFIAGGETICLVPLTPKIAVYFYNGTFLGVYVVSGNKEHCDKINALSLEAQKKKKYGYVIASKKQIITDLIERIK